MPKPRTRSQLVRLHCDLRAHLVCRASLFDGAILAGVGPVAAQSQTLFLVGEVILQPLSSRTDIDIFIGQIAKVRFDKATLRPAARGHRLRHCSGGVPVNNASIKLGNLGLQAPLAHFDKRVGFLQCLGENLCQSHDLLLVRGNRNCFVFTVI